MEINETEAERFEKAIRATREITDVKGGIGSLSEKVLHLTVKRYITPYDDEHEVKIGRYIADIVSENGITEIQTGNFHKIHKKLDAFLSVSPVTVVYPFAHKTRLIWVDPDSGEVGKGRKTPKTGRFCDAFFELYKIKQFLCHPNLKLRLLLIDMEEYRFLGWKKGKRYKTRRIDRIPSSLVSEYFVNTTADYAGFIPESLPENFTSEDFKKHAGITLTAAQTALNVLSHVSAVSKCGKSGRFHLYRRK